MARLSERLTGLDLGAVELASITNWDSSVIEDYIAMSRDIRMISNYLDQAVLTTSSPTFNTVNVSNTVNVTNDITIFEGSSLEFDVGVELFEILSTGLHKFGGLSINGGDNTKFDIGVVDGHVLNHLEGFEAYYEIAYLGQSAVTPSVASGITYIYIDNTGALVQTALAPTAETIRTHIFLGRVITSGGVVIQTQNVPVVALDPLSQFYDFGRDIGIFNISGNIPTPNANLTFNKSAGELFVLGGNFVIDPQDPHTVATAVKLIANFSYVTQLSVGTNTTLIDPTNYDVGGTITTVGGGANSSTVQRVYLFPSNNVRVAYGQTVYSSLSEAVKGIGTETFIVNPSVSGNGLLIGFLAVNKNATDLSDPTEAKFILASKFGEGSIGGAGQSVSSLQDAYNNSVDPEIVTDATHGAIGFQEGQGNDALDVVEVLNGVGTQTFAVDGNGNITTSGTVDGRDIAADGVILDDLNFTPTYGGYYHSNTVGVTTTTTISTDYLVGVGATIVAKDSSGITLVTGGGLRNTSGEDGLFEFSFDMGASYANSTGRWNDFGCIVRQSDDITYDAMVVGASDVYFNGANPTNPNGSCVVTLLSNETAFLGIRRTTSSAVNNSTRQNVSVVRIA